MDEDALPPLKPGECITTDGSGDGRCEVPALLPAWLMMVCLLPGPNAGAGESPADSRRTSSSGTLYGWSQGLV